MLSLLFLLAMWTEPFVYDLKAWVEPTECTSRGCALTPALDRAMRACEQELLPHGPSNRQYTGCLFLIPAGDHRITKTISACRAHTFQGRGGAHRRALSTLTSTVGTAFHARGYGDCGMGTSAGAITVRDLGLIFLSGEHTRETIGVFAEAKVHLENVWMIYADVGVLISADVTRPVKSNANASRLLNVATEYTRHAGMIFQGGDSNAHANLAFNASTACMAKGSEMERLKERFGPCGSVVDRSFLGNSHVAGHVAAAADYPDVVTQGASNHAQFLGLYVEGGTPPELGAQWSMWIGGIGPKPIGPGFRLTGNLTTSLRVLNDLDPNNQVTFEMGRATGTAGTYYGLRHTLNGWPLRMKWLPTLLGGSYLEDVGNASVGRVRSVRGTKDGDDSTVLGRTTHYDVQSITHAP